MLRALDLTPSTDEGQKYLDYQARVHGDTESLNVGYAPAFMTVAHLNNPKLHRDAQRMAPTYDVMKSSWKVK